MCYIVAIGIAGYRGDVVELFKSRKLLARTATNPTTAVLPGACYEVLEEHGHCSCGMLGSGGHGKGFDADRERRRLKRKGWKPAKIEAAVEALRLSCEEARTRPVADTPFVAAVKELAAGGAKISLMGHMFRASFDDAFTIEGETQLPLQHFIAAGGDIPSDRVVTLVD